MVARAESRRAGHVLPVGRLCRWLFLLLRWRAPDDGWRAAVARKLPGPWLVDLKPSGGPVLSGFSRRSDAVEAERVWLKEALWPQDGETHAP